MILGGWKGKKRNLGRKRNRRESEKELLSPTIIAILEIHPS